MALIFALFFFSSGFMTFRGADEVSRWMGEANLIFNLHSST